MIILSQEGNRIVDWSRVQKVYQLGSSAMIRYIGGEKDYDSFGKYSDRTSVLCACRR